jgi:molybdopterin synthase catalytic subunit
VDNEVFMFVSGAIPDTVLNNVSLTESNFAGAIAVFVGKVRADKIQNDSVESIEFTSQQQIAESTAKEIIEESKDRFGILNVEIWHSLGTVKTGEACFFVKVIGKHRKESFTALPFIVDEIKSRCPIFGKEILTGGGYKWKENKK